MQKKLVQLLDAWGKTDDEEEENKAEAIAEKTRKKLLDPATWADDARLVKVATDVRDILGEGVFDDYNLFVEAFDSTLDKLGVKPGAADKKTILNAISWRDESAPPVIKKVHKPGKAQAEPLYGRFEVMIDEKPHVVEYEPDSDLRDYEQIPLLENGGVPAFIEREVLPYVPDAWIDPSATRTGYEISFTRYFYKPQQLRDLDTIRSEILALEDETDGLLEQILNLGRKQ